MILHPRIRKTIKWGGAAVTALLVVVWVGSNWWYAGVVTSSGNLAQLIRGRIHIGNEPGVNGSGQVIFDHQYEGPFRLWYSSYPMSYGWRFAIPVWMPALVVGTIAGVAWRLDTLSRRLERAHLCPKCGYDRAGILKDAKCPECGATPSISAPSSSV